MAIDAAWGQPSLRDGPVGPRIGEVLETPGRRVSMTFAVVIALLVGLGLGNVFGSTGRELGEAARELETRTSELEAARSEVARLSVSADRFQDLLVDASRQGSVAEEGLIALARRSVAAYYHPVRRRPLVASADPAVPGLVGEWVRSYNQGDLHAHLSAYAPGAIVTYVQHGVQVAEDHGRAQIAQTARAAAPGRLRTSSIVQEGEFVWMGYARAGSSGVTVLRFSEGRIAQQWVLLDGSW